ncbi:MAG: class I SAM-dependent methyltransferase [Clostridia bacterium]|nr:class I SAM-dependent methyltransferase [Clostridia bacterium]
MKPDYQNWAPKPMVAGLWAATAVAAILFIIFNRAGLIWALLFGAATLILLFFAAWMTALYRAFDYDGKRKLAKVIIDGTADHVHIPDGGVGLDVGCGSGALTIACAKRNPRAQMVGCDVWSGAYRTVFTKQRCEDNARAEGVTNVRFQAGNAVRLPFEDESFDVVTSNYVYHNITGVNKQDLLMETLRVLKKGGSFAIHDLMGKARYGDMDAFVKKLGSMGYRDVKLIDTTDGTFMGRREAAWLGLGHSTLLVGRK